MTLRIPARRASLIRNYESALFYEKKLPRSERLYAFYLLTRPLFDWLKTYLITLGLEPDEAESELFILAAEIFGKFDPNKSSIIPYLSRAIIWETNHLLRLLDVGDNKQAPKGLLVSEESYHLDNEIYLKTPDILFEQKYLGKCFTKGQKYLISIILAADEKVTRTELARKAGMERKNLRDRLEEIKTILEHGGYNGRRS